MYAVPFPSHIPDSSKHLDTRTKHTRCCFRQLRPVRSAQSSSACCSSTPAPTSRRIALSGAATAMLLGQEAPAWALKTIELKDGSSVEVYEHGMTLSIVALRGSVPEQWIVEFRQCLGKYAGFELGQRGQLQELFDELGNPGAKKSAGVADVVTLGDGWLGPAIRRRLIQPIPSAETYRWWRRLPKRWQQLVQRDSDTGLLRAHGPIWGCPYRWGALLVAYKRDQLQRRDRQPISSWSDLLQPALKGRIAFPDNPREFVGIALKTLDHPLIGFNATETDLAAAGFDKEAVRQRVRQLRSQARLFSSQEHVRALLAGDVWVVIGSSTDLVPLAERTPSVDLVAPKDGTNLWADVWVVPANAEHGHLNSGPSPVLPSWLEFCVSPARADTLNGLKSGASPILLPEIPVEDHSLTRASKGGSSSSSSSTASSHTTGRHHRNKQQQQQDLDHHQQDLSQQQLLRQEQRQHMYEAAAEVPAPALRLSQAGNYMPPDVVMQLSEFMLPVDSQTLDFYRWLLT